MTSIEANVLTQRAAAKVDPTSLIAIIAKEAGVSPFKQLSEVFKLRSKTNGLTQKEYFDFQVYRSDLSLAEKREFVGEKGSFRLNLKLAPPGVTHLRGFLTDKVGMNSVMEHFGLPTTKTLAVFSPNRFCGKLRTLRTADEVMHYLTQEAPYPLFGKPVKGFQALGSVWIESIDRDTGLAHLSSGASAPLARLVAEIAAHTEDGFLFQAIVEQHPDLNALTGSASVATVRVVTVVEKDRPRVLYTLWKIPGDAAMSDNFWQKGSMIALVNAETGIIEKCRRGTGTRTEWVETHPVTGMQIKGFQMPHWESVIDNAIAAHSMFPINGVLGWDIAIGPEGATVIECNENTAHMLYQLASGRGVLNADFMPIFDRVIARNDKFSADFKSKQQAYAQSN